MKFKRFVLGLIILFMAVSVRGFAQQDNKVDNAAVYYLQAIDVIEYPDNLDFRHKCDNVIKNGWSQPDADLENFIKNNKSCLELIKKAALLENCDFDYAKNYKYLIDKDYRYLNNLMKLEQLLLTSARYYEFQGDWEQVANSCFTVLTLAYHASQDRGEMGKLLSLFMEEATYPIIEKYLEQPISDPELIRVLGVLDNHKKLHFPVKSLVEEGKRYYVSTMQMIADRLIEQSEEKYKKDTAVRKKAKKFADDVVKQSNELSNEYYGKFITAIESNKEEAWKMAKESIESLRSGVYPEFPDTNSIFFNSVIKESDANAKVISRKIAVTMLVTIMPDFKKTATRYYSILDKLNKLQVIAEDKKKE